MPTFLEILDEAAYQQAMNAFISALPPKMAETENVANMANEMSLRQKNIRRFVAYSDSGQTAGFLVLLVREGDLRIESIGAHPEATIKKGVARGLVEAAVNLSFALGKGGTVTLSDQSKGTGTAFYSYMGFEVTEGSEMRLIANGDKRWKWAEGPVLDTSGQQATYKKGTAINWTKLQRC